LALVLGHYEAMLRHYGERIGTRAARKHLGWYLDQVAVPAALRSAVMTANDSRDVVRLIASAFAEDMARAA
ncbi:MAG: tRNA-dihydrouridine synthase, partial [Bauldia sp.]|nr:tRNA-dihydrouridine synthase [Bauldia sp.]